VYNLLDNALLSMRKRSRKERSVVVRTRLSAMTAVLTVQDVGTGIEDEFRDLIWKPFFSTWRRGIGSGIGLFMCKYIVEDFHGGRIDFESHCNVGTTFTVELPSNVDGI